MRTIIAGSRGITSTALVAIVMSRAIEQGIKPTLVLSGTARGVDQLGEWWARRAGLPVEQCPAEWEVHGRKAGYLRNLWMAEHADALVALWDGSSRGTQHMIRLATKRGLKTLVWNDTLRRFTRHCVDCGEALSQAEARHYDWACERCERHAHQRMAAVMYGGETPE